MELTSLKVVLNSARMAFGVVSAEMVGMFWMPMLFAGSLASFRLVSLSIFLDNLTIF